MIQGNNTPQSEVGGKGGPEPFDRFFESVILLPAQPNLVCFVVGSTKDPNAREQVFIDADQVIAHAKELKDKSGGKG